MGRRSVIPGACTTPRFDSTRGVRRHPRVRRRPEQIMLEDGSLKSTLASFLAHFWRYRRSPCGGESRIFWLQRRVSWSFTIFNVVYFWTFASETQWLFMHGFLFLSSLFTGETTESPSTQSSSLPSSSSSSTSRNQTFILPLPSWFLLLEKRHSLSTSHDYAEGQVGYEKNGDKKKDRHTQSVTSSVPESLGKFTLVEWQWPRSHAPAFPGGK